MKAEQLINIFSKLYYTCRNSKLFVMMGLAATKHGLKFLMGNLIFATFFCTARNKNNSSFMTIRIVLGLVSIYTHL